MRETEFSTRPKRDGPKAEIQMPEPAPQGELPIFSLARQVVAPIRTNKPNINRGVAIGDTVRVRYQTGDCKVLMITISATKSDPGQGVIHYEAHIAKALLGSEEGDEVEMLNGPYVRSAVVEAIVKPN